MKEKAEGVRNLGCPRGGEFADGRLLDFEKLGVGVLANLLGELAQILDRREGLCPTLLLHNRAQARGEESHFLP